MIEFQDALRKKEIWAVGGGKGGIGKSLITGNIGITLARLKKRVLLVDADLGGANLHTTLGIGVPEMTLSDFLNRRVETIQDVIIKTSIPNLSLVSGAQDFLDAANPNFAQKARLLRHLETLDADYILLDLGAGTSFNILDFFLFADHGILVVLPEPTAIENAYRFIKSAFYRRFKKDRDRPEHQGPDRCGHGPEEQHGDPHPLRPDRTHQAAGAGKRRDPGARR